MISEHRYPSDIEKNGGKQRLLRVLYGVCSLPHAQIKPQCVEDLAIDPVKQ